MACHYPLQAWRGIKDNKIYLSQPTPENVPAERRLQLPCTQCLGCRKTAAKAWALRCRLEMQQHAYATFATLTYDPKYCPPTLRKADLQLYLKRLRINASRHYAIDAVRFFACGEYGTQRGRPHYHAILYGLHYEQHRNLIEKSWGLGDTQTKEANNRRIAYTAGYVAKKYNEAPHEAHERVDPETGEVYDYEPPFLQMSRKPGIGGHARQWPASWRAFAINDGHKMPVPRFYHESWKQQATEEEKEKLLQQKAQLALKRDNSPERLKAKEQIAIRQQQLHQQQRKIG